MSEERLEYHLLRFLYLLEVENIVFDKVDNFKDDGKGWEHQIKKAARLLAQELNVNEKLQKKGLKLGDLVVLDMFKKLREKIIEENVCCSNREDKLKNDLETILKFYFDLPNKVVKTEAFINVCIVCDLYYQMRNHLLQHE